MQADYFHYWGKADEKYVGATTWHPLVYHSLDVAACGHALLTVQPSWLRTMQRLSGLRSEILQQWIIFLLAIHDAGKFSDGFQFLRPDLWKILHGRTDKARYGERHDTLGYELTLANLSQWLRQPDLAKRSGQCLQPWLASVTGHHGKPPKNLSKGDSAMLLRDHYPVHVRNDVKQFILETQNLLMSQDFQWTALLEGQVGKTGKLYG